MADSDNCLACVRKHICQAMIVHEEEVPLGYPDDVDRVIGHLSEACRHARKKHPELASVLRTHRLRVMDDSTYYPPYSELRLFVRTLIACEGQNLPLPELPESLKLTVADAG